jgi:hypothetical protein
MEKTEGLIFFDGSMYVFQSKNFLNENKSVTLQPI